MTKLKNTSKKHKESDLKGNFAVVSVSSTRTLKEDDAGDLMVEIIEKAGHKVVHRTIVKDDITMIKKDIDNILAMKNVDAIMTSGGTGIAKKDVTIEAVKPFDKEITGFGILFTTLSYEKVGTVSMISRATAGIKNDKAIFCVPGSPRACKLALEKLILEEIGHILKHRRE